ncbi:MAG: hypothetical protein M0R76_11275 [Proteobacteria bacterium]|nr:hypothetical protein [Pseudomonadota bacterium]
MRWWVIGCWMWLSCVSTGCLVTDDIAFELATNHPGRLVSQYPPSDTLGTALPGETKEFTVTIWDPDDRDVGNFDSRITLVEHLNSAVTVRNTISCQPPVTEEATAFHKGVLITFRCAIAMRVLYPSTETLLVEVELSDRLYLPGNELPKDANALRVQWTFDLLPSEAL